MSKNNELNFDFDEFDRFEDIVSDSGMARTSGKSDGKHYRRKSRGIKGWWKKLTRGKKVLTVILSVLIVLTGLIVINPFHMIEHMIYNYNNMTENEAKLGFKGKIDPDVINVALFGIDTRNKNTFKGNSDSIMILSLNTKLKTVKIVSVMRDTIVPIEQDGKTKYGKINSIFQSMQR